MKFIRDFSVKLDVEKIMDTSGKYEALKKFIKKETLEFFFEYETPKVVKLYSYKIGSINRSLQLLVLTYIVGYIFIYCKGYQFEEKGESNTVAKIKGMIRTNFSRMTDNTTQLVWDPTDLVIPAVENDAAFVTTNFIQTSSQHSGRCPEDRTIKEARCQTDSDCPAGEKFFLGNGFRTGKCVVEAGACEIEGWCPTEKDITPEPPVFMDAADFTILVKNYVTFPEAKAKRRSILENATTEYISKCLYHPQGDKFCPIFRVGDIVEFAHENFSEVARTGAIFSFIIEWDCNLDFNETYCYPKYSFRRMDSKDEKIAKGWNFRHADYWNAPDGTRMRTLYKYYGIRFVFTVYSKAGKFHAETFAMNLGSAVGLLGITTVLCEFLTMFLMRKKRSALRDKKIDRISVQRKKPRLKDMLQKSSGFATHIPTPDDRRQENDESYAYADESSDDAADNLYRHVQDDIIPHSEERIDRKARKTVETDL